MFKEQLANLITQNGRFAYGKQRAFPQVQVTGEAQFVAAKFDREMGTWHNDKMSVPIATHEAANSISVQDAKAHLDDLIARIMRGEEWTITDSSGQTVAVLVPAKQHSEVSSKPVLWPDFMARLRAQWPAGTPGTPLSEIVDQGRGPRP